MLLKHLVEHANLLLYFHRNRGPVLLGFFKSYKLNCNVIFCMLEVQSSKQKKRRLT